MADGGPAFSIRYTSLGFLRDPTRDVEYAPGRWLWSFVLTFDEAD